jgi:hypothetical protein
MTKDEIRGAVKAVPFEPFTVHITDGRNFKVPTADHVSLSPNGRVLHIWHERGGSDRVDVALITSIETEPPHVDA